MKKNDIVEIEITALSSECSGIGKKDGMVIFVPFSAIGDKLEVKILKVNKTYCYGKIERIITPSPDRVTPDCPIYTKCGGCSLRHISYEAQLRAKEQFVKDAFTRIGGLSPEFLPIIRNTNINGYRNKLQIPIGTDKDGNLIAGFYAFHSHRIVPCEKCLLQPDIFSKITADFLKISTGLNLTAYDETTHKGILRHLYLRKGYYSGEICLCIVVAKNVPEIKILSDRLLEKYPDIVSSVINVNNRDTNVILGDEEIVLTSKNYICDIMCKNAVNIAPKAFYQVNTPCAEQLYSSACDFAEPKGKTVLDLYCGAGTIGLSMARTAKKIIGVEIVPEAIENAKQNALANDITNCEFICADAAEAARILHSRSLRPDVIMVDPPRKGCGRDACEQIAAFSAPRIVMVSCNAATAARDCACFAELGYSTDKCVAVDMFSGTNHIDTYGTGKLKKELVNRDIVNSGCYILGAGVYPGLTGIAMNYLVKKYPSIKKWKGMAGSYEPIGAGAAEDLLYSCLYGFGIENAYWKHGQIKVPKRKEIEEIYIPQLQKTKNIALFLPDEILQIAKENDLETIRWYNILPNKEHMAIMKKAYQKLLQRNDIATEIQEFEEITRKSTEHWNIISFNSDDAEVGQILVKLEISNTSAYKMTGIVAALLAIRSAQTKRKSGIWNAYETIQMQYVFEKLQEEGVFIKETQEVSAVYEESEETGIL